MYEARSPHRRFSKEASNLAHIFSKWRIVHIIVFFIIVSASIAAWISFAYCEKKLQGRCLLFSTVSIIKVSRNQYRFQRNASVPNRTTWGSRSTCKFCSYSSIISFVFAVVWIILFCTCFSEKKKKNVIIISLAGPWRLVSFLNVCGLLMAIVTTSTAVVMTLGSSYFCNSFKTTILRSCVVAERVSWNGSIVMNGFYNALLQAELAAWAISMSWWLQSFLAFLRLCTRSDFHVSKAKRGRLLHVNRPR